jgi:parallel beta-helix repeat protein
MRGYLLLILILIIGSVHAARITVGPEDEDYKQIQQAIDNASMGDVIEVHSGVYSENLYAYKAIILQGIDTGEGLPVINASGSSSALNLEANGSIVQGLNLTGSGHCGCGNAGIHVGSSNNTILNNILYKNKYGIYVTPGSVNNTFMFNDFLENKIAASDHGNNSWNGSLKDEGLQRLLDLLTGKHMRGNHYSDYDEIKEGCNDTNNDTVCDQPRKIDGGTCIDLFPSVMRENS